MKIISLAISALLSITGLSCIAAPLTDEQVREIRYTYPTQFGDLKLFKENGKLGVPTTRIDLDSKLFLNPTSSVDGWGETQSLIPMDFLKGSAVDTIPRTEKKIGREITKHLLLAEAPDGNCLRKFIILDFTLDKPFISDRFGENRDMKECLTFINAKWGAKESRIKLNTGNYLYKAGGTVTRLDPE
jgi:hypothetical protein